MSGAPRQYNVYASFVDRVSPCQISLSGTATVDDLRRALCPRGTDCDETSWARSVNLYKFDKMVCDEDVSQAVSLDSLSGQAPMKPTKRLSSYFPGQFSTDSDVIHVVAEFDTKGSPPGFRNAGSTQPPKQLREGDHSEHIEWALLHRYLWVSTQHWADLIDQMILDVPSQYCSLVNHNEQKMEIQMPVQFLNISRVPGFHNPQFLEMNGKGSGRLFIREVYRELDRFLPDGQSSPNNSHRYTDMLILGQPGIGKTLYLNYLLFKRLAEARTTVLSLSPTHRYLFREDGVYWVPEKTILEMPNINQYEDGALVLYDLNTNQPTIEKTVGWAHVIAASPHWSPHYCQWEEENSYTNARFVMHTWSWPEMCSVRDQASGVAHNRTLDQWRDAFAKFGGLPRNLLYRDNDSLEAEIDQQINLLFPDPIRRLLALDPDRVIHPIIHIYRVEQPFSQLGSLVPVRHKSSTRIPTSFIAHRIVGLWHSRLIADFKANITPFLRSSVTTSVADVLFELVAHKYILKYDSPPLIADSLSTLPPFSLNLQNVTTKDILVSKERSLINDEPLEVDKYYRSQAPDLPGIDAFVFKEDEKGDIDIIAFQFTVLELHPIPVKHLSDLWDLIHKPPSSEPNIHFVFVVPKGREREMGAQPYKCSLKAGIWKGRV